MLLKKNAFLNVIKKKISFLTLFKNVEFENEIKIIDAEFH